MRNERTWELFATINNALDENPPLAPDGAYPTNAAFFDQIGRSLRFGIRGDFGGAWGAYVPHGTGIYAPSVGTGGATLPAYLPGGAYGLNCGPTGGCTNSQVWPTSAPMSQLLDSRVTNPNAPWSMASFTDYAGKRTTDNDVQTYQFLAGFEGELEGRDMTWEAYISHGSTDVSTLFGGVISIERYRYLVNLPNYGRNAFDQGNDFSAAHIAGGTLRCQTGLPIVENFTPSPDCIDAIVADLQSTSEMDQTIAELNVQGKLVDMWAGEARFAAGVSHRENTYFYIQDGLASQTSFLDGAVGIFPGGNSQGEVSTAEIYGELLVPLASEAGVFEEFSLELGYRYSDNDPTEPVADVQGHVRLARQRSFCGCAAAATSQTARRTSASCSRRRRRSSARAAARWATSATPAIPQAAP